MIPYEHPILEELNKLPFTFYPTGSRYLGVHTEHSDYDFYAGPADAASRNKLREALEKLGFAPLSSSGYCDDLGLESVMRRKGPPDVDVLIGDPEEIAHRRRVFEMLASVMKQGYHERGALLAKLKGSAEGWSQLFQVARLMTMKPPPK